MNRRMPAEWEKHEATWLAWPHNASDWLGEIEPVYQSYLEIITELSAAEHVHVLCNDDAAREHAEKLLRTSKYVAENVRLHVVPTNRSWLRDTAPTMVKTSAGDVELIDWGFNAWARYDDYQFDNEVPKAVAQISGLARTQAFRDDGVTPLVMEGGAFDTDGDGTLLVTEECLLSDQQVRNPGMTRLDYERAFEKYLGISKTIWLAQGICGDDTHGHIDDVARFVGPGKIVLCAEEKSRALSSEALIENLRRLEGQTDAKGRPLKVITLPLPEPIEAEDQLLPASYANFYIANKVILVPVFEDGKDDRALGIIEKLFPGRRIVGINCRHFVLGLGTIHCATQQQPSKRHS